MTVDSMVDTVWKGVQRRVHHPQELRGKLSVEDAYRVQLGLLARHQQAGERQAGWKVGVTSKAVQAQLGLAEPVFGFLLESGHKPNGSVFDVASLIRPAFENELCITMGATLVGPGVTLEQGRSAISHVAPALEIVETRGDVLELELVLADNSQQKAFVTGRAQPFDGLGQR